MTVAPSSLDRPRDSRSSMSRGNQRDVDRARSQKRADRKGNNGKKKKDGDKNQSQALTNKKERYDTHVEFT